MRAGIGRAHSRPFLSQHVQWDLLNGTALAANGQPNFWEPKMGLWRVPWLLGLLWDKGMRSGRKEKLELTGSIKGLVRGLLRPLLP